MAFVSASVHLKTRRSTRTLSTAPPICWCIPLPSDSTSPRLSVCSKKVSCCNLLFLCNLFISERECKWAYTSYGMLLVRLFFERFISGYEARLWGRLNFIGAYILSGS